MVKGGTIDKIKWKGNNPHANSPDIKTINEAVTPLPLNSEIIWLSDSNKGDCHDNINVKMFMKWITIKVIPLAVCNYTGVQMIPVMDNAPYHHVHGIPPLVRFSKKSTVNLMKEHGIEYVLLPLTDERISILTQKYNRTINNGHLRIPFNGGKVQKIKTKSNALKNPSAEEIKVATIVWRKRHKNEVLICNMEKVVKDAGGKVLWTPPY